MWCRNHKNRWKVCGKQLFTINNIGNIINQSCSKLPRVVNINKLKGLHQQVKVLWIELWEDWQCLVSSTPRPFETNKMKDLAGFPKIPLTTT
jgi:hypothetical protein